jgi:hypothetical protein
MVNRRLPRIGNWTRHAWFAILTALAALSAAPARGAETAECWRGWGYLSDPDTRAYVSAELLLVTRGAADWRAGVPVALFQLDRSTGAIAAERPAMTVIPSNPRLYYRGRTNYVDGRATILGREQMLVFGLSHIAPPAGGLEAMLDYNRWACGLAARE